MTRFTKILSIIIFKRVFEKYSFILFYPKIVMYKQKSILKNYILLQKYILLYSYNFKLDNFNSSNLVMSYFIIKSDFLNKLKVSLNIVYGLKFNNIFFDSIFLNKYKNLFLFSKKNFFLALQEIHLPMLKYIYSFLRILIKI